MRAWRATEFGTDLNGIEIQDLPEPSPGKGEVSIAVAASGVALPDLLMLSGSYPEQEHDLPHPLGLEFAGVVKDCGADVTSLAPGDRVCAVIFPPQGAASEVVVAAENDVAKLPDSLSMREGAAVPSAFMTAHDALYRHGSLRPDDRVLVLSAASGLGLAAIQIAAAAGAEVYGAASAAKHDSVRAAGAVEVFDYSVEGWQTKVPELDLVLDTIGGPSFRHSYDRLRAGGRLVCVDAVSRYPTDPKASDFIREPGDPTFNPIDLIFDGKSVVGINMPLLWELDGGQRPLLNDALSHFEAGKIKPVLSETFPFEDLVEALRFVQERRNVGRVILDVGAGA